MTSSFMVPSEPSAAKQPLHIAISEQLKAKIEAGQYEPGARLPSEFDLGEAFGVSRTTIRRAVANLTQQGLVTTQRGKGIFVKDRHKISFSMSNPLMQFDDALKQQGYTAHVHTLRFQQIKAPAEVTRQLALPSQRDQIYWQEKILYADQSPVALDISYFPSAIGNALADQLQRGFTYSTLTTNGIHLCAAEVRLESVPATYELSEYLAVPLGMPLLVFNYVAYWGKNRTPAVCGKTLSRSDWTCYTSQIELDDYVGPPMRID
ncbi:MAG: GntR family transcriptional regulator [Cyanobacteria bacterium P01_D01_bin.44]